MAVPPIRYRTTDYPPKYRPLGYWRHARRQADADGGAAAPDRFRRRFLILLAVLLATLVLHAGIAVAYLRDDSASSSEQATEEVTDPEASCEDPGQPDPEADPQESPVDETPVPGAGEGTGTGDPVPPPEAGADRGAL